MQFSTALGEAVPSPDDEVRVRVRVSVRVRVRALDGKVPYVPARCTPLALVQYLRNSNAQPRDLPHVRRPRYSTQSTPPRVPPTQYPPAQLAIPALSQ